MNFKTLHCLVAILFFSSAGAFAAETPGQRPLTVADSIEATRLVPIGSGADVLLSPGGIRYVLVCERGDVTRNGAWMRFVSGRLAAIATTEPPATRELFTKSKARITGAGLALRWLDDARVAFMWDDGESPARVVSLNLETGKMADITGQPTAITNFDLSANERTVIYSVNVERGSDTSDKMRREGFVVGNVSAYDVLRGSLERPEFGYFQLLVRSPAQTSPRQVTGMDRPMVGGPDLMRLSPDGQWAVVSGPIKKYSPTWERYTNAWLKTTQLPMEREHPDDPGLVRQLYLVDVKRAEARPLWNALAGSALSVVWSANSERVVVGPTYLPTEMSDDPLGLAGFAVAEVNIADGSFSRIPIPVDSAMSTWGSYRYRPARWLAGNIIQLDVYGPRAAPRLSAQKTSNGWKILDGKNDHRESEPNVQFEMRQDLNTPPALFAVEKSSGKEKLIWESNPALRGKFLLGRVEKIHWQDKQGRAWTGALCYPVHFAPGRRFPLVLYPHGLVAGGFSLDGPYTTIYATQPLANLDIATLVLRFPDVAGQEITIGPSEAKTVMIGCESAIEHLVAAGLVDREKVGLAGFSRIGWYVDYVLSRSAFPFAAAIAADNIDGSYLQNIFGAANARKESETDIGAAAYGDGLSAWLRAAPGFNTDKMHTPLRMERDTGGAISIIGAWEIFSNLRAQNKPVEMVVVPDSEHAAHPLQNPEQRLYSQGGAVDWFDFWLNGHERTAPVTIAGETKEKLAEQYARWRKLRDLHESDLKAMAANTGAKN